jgi:hypothetical protein
MAALIPRSHEAPPGGSIMSQDRQAHYLSGITGGPAPTTTLDSPPQIGSSLMATNRSVPSDTVLPHITYRDVAQASAWLTAMLGFTEHYRYGPPGAPSGAQMYLGEAWVMLDAAKPGPKVPAELGYGTQSLTVFVADVDAHYNIAKGLASRS